MYSNFFIYLINKYTVNYQCTHTYIYILYSCYLHSIYLSYLVVITTMESAHNANVTSSTRLALPAVS
jgi:hypothetical protein